MQVEKAVADKLGFDLTQAVADFIVAKEAHKSTVGVPAPTAHPLVEEIYRSGGKFEIVDTAPDTGEPFGPTWAEQVASRISAIESAVYIPPDDPHAIPDRVSSRQFGLQLEAMGLLDTVEAWVATQSKDVQIAYNRSGTFVRTEPMMQAGLKALGFSEAEVDEFFLAASKL